MFTPCPKIISLIHPPLNKHQIKLSMEEPNAHKEDENEMEEDDDGDEYSDVDEMTDEKLTEELEYIEYVDAAFDDAWMHFQWDCIDEEDEIHGRLYNGKYEPANVYILAKCQAIIEGTSQKLKTNDGFEYTMSNIRMKFMNLNEEKNDPKNEQEVYDTLVWDFENTYVGLSLGTARRVSILREKILFEMKEWMRHITSLQEARLQHLQSLPPQVKAEEDLVWLILTFHISLRKIANKMIERGWNRFIAYLKNLDQQKQQQQNTLDLSMAGLSINDQQNTLDLSMAGLSINE